MKNVAPNARSFESERPLTVAAIACSRTPKCRFFPPGFPAWKLPAPSYVRVVLFDGPRSAERLAVGRGGVLLVRGAVADVAIEDDEGGTALRFPEDAESLLDAIEVVGLAHAQDVPPVPQESGGDILSEGEARLPLDRDVVVVVDPAEVVQTEVTGQRGRFGRHALHQTAVAAHDVDVIVEDR